MATTEMNCLASGGSGLEFSQKEVGYAFTSASGSTTITVSTMTKIKAVIYWFDAYPQTCGYGYLDGNTLVADTSSGTGGITAISGNTFTFAWNDALALHAVILGD